MNVLMTTDTVGGVWTYALGLAHALAPHGIDVHLATMGPPPDREQRAAARSGLASLHESSFALEWEDRPWEDVDAAGDWLLALAEELRPDVVHLNGYAHAALGWSAPVVVVAHSDVISWWRAVRETPPPEWLTTYRDRVGAGLEAADAVVAPTRAVLDDLRASYGFEGGVVVANGRAPLSAPRVPKEPLIVGLGRFRDEAKNVAALTDVPHPPAWTIELAGDGTPRGRVSAEEAAALLARASIFASPARYEPFGLAALEAAHAGCALVLGDIPSLREVWADAALYVPPEDGDALARALDELAGDERVLRGRANRARERARRYSPAAAAEGTLQVYESVLARTEVRA